MATRHPFVLLTQATRASNLHARYQGGGACNTNELGHLIIIAGAYSQSHQSSVTKLNQEFEYQNQGSISKQNSRFWVFSATFSTHNRKPVLGVYSAFQMRKSTRKSKQKPQRKYTTESLQHWQGRHEAKCTSLDCHKHWCGVITLSISLCPTMELALDGDPWSFLPPPPTPSKKNNKQTNKQTKKSVFGRFRTCFSSWRLSVRQ